MTYDFYSFVENWCKIYKPIQHVSGEDSQNKRFFLTTGFMGLADWMRSANPDKSPVIIMETNIEGDLGDYDTANHIIYCAVRATSQQDGHAFKEAVTEGKKHLSKLWTYILNQKKVKNPYLEGVRLDSLLHYKSMGPIYDGWLVVYFDVDEVKRVNLCVDENDYVGSGSGSGSGE